MATAVLPDREIARLTVDAYLRAAEDGLWGESPRIELIEGVVYRMSPVSIRHNWLVLKLLNVINAAAGSRPFTACPGTTLVLDESSAPEPDVIVWPGSISQGPQAWVPADALMVVEVSVSTLAVDLGTKAALYAAAGIREYWVIDPAAKRIIMHRNPVAAQAQYALTIELSGAEAAVPAALPEVRIVPETLFA